MKNKINITEKMSIHKQWYIDANEQTLESLPMFLDDLMNKYNHDYGTICHALASGAIATMWSMNKHPEQGGITGFQASCILWEIIRNWSYPHNKCGMRLIDYDDLLYPQYARKFSNTLSKESFDKLKEVAAKKLSESGTIHPDVKRHWESIVSGNVPFGFVIKEEE